MPPPAVIIIGAVRSVSPADAYDGNRYHVGLSPTYASQLQRSISAALFCHLRPVRGPDLVSAYHLRRPTRRVMREETSALPRRGALIGAAPHCPPRSTAAAIGQPTGRHFQAPTAAALGYMQFRQTGVSFNGWNKEARWRLRVRGRPSRWKPFHEYAGKMHRVLRDHRRSAEGAPRRTRHFLMVPKRLDALPCWGRLARTAMSDEYQSRSRADGAGRHSFEIA